MAVGVLGSSSLILAILCVSTSVAKSAVQGVAPGAVIRLGIGVVMPVINAVTEAVSWCFGVLRLGN